MNLFTDEYIALCAQLHNENEKFGANGFKLAEDIREFIRLFNIKSILDYGCGKATLHAALYSPNLNWQNYDPAIPQYASSPSPAELVVCADVMEHIEPELTENVLDHIYTLSERFVFFNIALTPATKKLPDGRNSHINLINTNSWLKLLMNYWLLSDLKTITKLPYKSISIFGVRL